MFKMLKAQLNDTINIWISSLSHYDFDTLLKKPDSESWSLGQIFMHLIDETNYYIQQIECCLNSNDNVEKSVTEKAKAIFANNALPDKKIRRDAGLSQDLLQPASKAEIFHKMQQLKIELNSLGNRIDEGTSVGKTRHPGLGYFNAQQWFQFAEIHMRHHLRQKKTN
jgi:hypothetical protein